VPRTDDAVRDLAALGAGYVTAALRDPFLYRAMFDAAADLEDPAAADLTFGLLGEAAGRAREVGRLDSDVDALAVATRFWMTGHGLAMLVITGVLPPAAVAQHGQELGVGVFVAAGDDPARCRESVRLGWASTGPGEELVGG